MKKKRKSVKTVPRGQPKSPNAQSAGDKTRSRRSFLNTIRYGALAVAVVGGGGYYLVDTVRATMAEHDLSRLGTGTPTIVQIHDPQCRLCTALQKEVRQALTHFDDGKLDYLVADIRTPEGSAMAGRYGVAHVTLLLFDEKGGLIQVLNGPQDREFLRRTFDAHVNTYGTS